MTIAINLFKIPLKNFDQGKKKFTKLSLERFSEADITIDRYAHYLRSIPLPLRFLEMRK